MGIYLEWGVGWYYIVGIALAIWIGTMFYRKDYKMRQPLLVGAITTAIAFIVENIAVSQGIWNYAPGNWPLILWPSYFLSGMGAYQIVKLVDEKLK